MPYPWRTLAALLALLLVTACDPSVDPADRDLTAPSVQDEGRIGADVLAALRDGGEARVMIALQLPTGSERQGLATLRTAVADVQKSVMTRVDPDDMTTIRAYQAVPALTGTIRDRSALLKLAADPRVRRIDLDLAGTGALGTSVPQIGADHRQARGNDGEGVVVAILDTGLDTDHPDLADDVLQQACFGDDDGSIDGNGFCPGGSDRETGPGAAEDDAGHGTHVSGIVTSAGTVSSPGVAPGAGIVGIKVLDDCSFAGCFSAFSEIVAALDWIITNQATLNVDLINMSLGTSALFDGDCDAANASAIAGAAAINTLRGMGITAFASAGNDGSGTQMSLPACLSNVISVGSVDSSDGVATGSNSNASTDIFAPGVGIVSLAIGGGTTTAGGTSMASPTAAGCAALLMEAGDATTPDQIETRLETSTVSVTDPTNSLSFPRIQCEPDTNNPPAVEAGGPYTTNEAVGVQLAGASAFDADGDPITRLWSVDSPLCGFSSTTAAQPTLTCGDNGSFTVTLTVDDGLDPASDVATVTVNNVAPVIDAFAVAPEAIIVGQDAGADGSFSDVPADVLSATVDWADGTSDPVSSPFSISHTYLASGLYEVTLTVSDDDGGVTEASAFVDVLSPAEAIAALMSEVEGLGLAPGTENSLLAMLSAILDKLEDGRTGPAINQLGAFIDHVESLRTEGKIADADAAALTATAEAIRAALIAGLS